jgi:hypothetical protein
MGCTQKSTHPSPKVMPAHALEKKPTKHQTHPRNFIVNTRMFTFDSAKINPWIPQITHLSVFGVDFQKGKVNGNYTYANKDRVDDLISFTKRKDLKVVWTLNMQSTTLEQELAYVTDLINRGMPISAFKYGGEFYLGKYYIGDTSKKGVVEKVNISIYKKWLKEWVPTFAKRFPFDQYDHILVGASYGKSNSRQDQYRRLWNQELIKMLDQNPTYIDKLAVDFHHYAGREKVVEPNGEETIESEVSFDFLHDFPEQMPIYITESGYRIDDYSIKSLKKAYDYWTAFYQELGPNDYYGVHLLYTDAKKNPHALYLSNGKLSPVGEKLRDWFREKYMQ